MRTLEQFFQVELTLGRCLYSKEIRDGIKTLCTVVVLAVGVLAMCALSSLHAFELTLQLF